MAIKASVKTRWRSYVRWNVIPTGRITSGQLDRSLYEEVNEVLVRLGGKWKGGRTKAHLFPYDPRPLVAV